MVNTKLHVLGKIDDKIGVGCVFNISIHDTFFEVEVHQWVAVSLESPYVALRQACPLLSFRAERGIPNAIVFQDQSAHI